MKHNFGVTFVDTNFLASVVKVGQIVQILEVGLRITRSSGESPHFFKTGKQTKENWSESAQCKSWKRLISLCVLNWPIRGRSGTNWHRFELLTFDRAESFFVAIWYLASTLKWLRLFSSVQFCSVQFSSVQSPYSSFSKIVHLEK